MADPYIYTIKAHKVIWGGHCFHSKHEFKFFCWASIFDEDFQHHPDGPYGIDFRNSKGIEQDVKYDFDIEKYWRERGYPVHLFDTDIIDIIKSLDKIDDTTFQGGDKTKKLLNAIVARYKKIKGSETTSFEIQPVAQVKRNFQLLVFKKYGPKVNSLSDEQICIAVDQNLSRTARAKILSVDDDTIRHWQNGDRPDFNKRFYEVFGYDITKLVRIEKPVRKKFIMDKSNTVKIDKTIVKFRAKRHNPPELIQDKIKKLHCLEYSNSLPKWKNDILEELFRGEDTTENIRLLFGIDTKTFDRTFDTDSCEEAVKWGREGYALMRLPITNEELLCGIESFFECGGGVLNEIVQMSIERQMKMAEVNG